MTDCQLLSDRMASVARGDSSWTDAERDHLARCDACREEWRVVGVTIRAGARTPALDPALVAAGVRGRLVAHRRDLRLIRRWVGVAAVAAAAAAKRDCSKNSRRESGDIAELAEEVIPAGSDAAGGHAKMNSRALRSR